MITAIMNLTVKIGASTALAATAPSADEAQLLEFVRDWYIGLLLPAGSVLAGLVILYGGIIYAQSGGDPNKVGQAKEYIFGAISGLALLITSVLIIRTITG